MNKRLYIDFHVLQTVPPSCVNRDDTGSPKTAVYGGMTRARVSSQAWKHAMREMFKEMLPKEQMGERTKRIVLMVARAIELGQKDLFKEEVPPSSTAMRQARDALTKAGLELKEPKTNKKKSAAKKQDGAEEPDVPSEPNSAVGQDDIGVDALFFMSHAQAQALADLVKRGEKDPATYKNALAEHPSADMALFGRMVADDPTLNYDAAAQVAHAISTHAVQNEFDYFTAVDDLMPEDNAGAGHLGTVEFNSATLYRYATVNAVELCKHLGAEETPRVVRAFAEAFVRAMPTGKQNTFANRTLPDAVIVTIREDQPVNLCGAFEKVIPASAEGFVERSKRALADYAKNLYVTYVDAPAQTLKVGADMPFPALLDALEREVATRLAQMNPKPADQAEKD